MAKAHVRRLLLWAAFSAVAIQAAIEVGYLFGLTCGLAVSPIARSAATLIFGLLAAIGVAGTNVAKPDEWTNTRLWLLLVTALAVICFCVSCQTGIANGSLQRIGPYPRMEAVFPWPNGTSAELRSEVYQLRWRLHQQGMARAEFVLFAEEVIEPLLANPKLTVEQKRAKLAALALKPT